MNQKKHKGGQAPSMAELRHRNNAHANLLKRSSPVFLKPLPSVTLTALGTTARFKVLNSGYLTGFFVTMSLVAAIGTATATLSPRSLHGAISRIRFTDFSQVDRLNLSGYQLFIRNSINNYYTGLAGMSLTPSAASTALATAGVTSGFTNPNTTLTVGSPTQKLTFYVPIAKDMKRGDLRGMVDCEAVEGEATLSIELNTLLYTNGNDDYVFNGAATTTASLTSVTFDVVQEFYYPQAVNGVIPRPVLDMRTVYELAGCQRTTDNLSAGTDKVINLPNNRSIRRAYINYQNNGILGGSSGNELSKIKFVVGGANYIRDVSEQLQQFLQLQDQGVTLPKGSYFLEYDHGLETSAYGISQVVVTPGGTLVNPYVEMCYESLYTVGAPLSALANA